MAFQGYWHNESAAKEMIDEDGWLHTGDLGALTTRGSSPSPAARRT